MKKFSMILESTSNKKKILIDRLSNLKFFITDRNGVNMRQPVDKILGEMSTSKDYNDVYQLPLSLLHKTGKYPDIKFVNGKWHSESLKNVSLVVDVEGKWHPVNKLNTNYVDLSELLCDIFEKLGLIDEVSNIKQVDELKRWLISFRTNNDIYSLIKKFIPDIKSYTTINRRFSIIGENAENMVAKIIKSKGAEILYQGGDGDFIDMIYGTDLIVGKNDKIYLAQVKSNPAVAKKSLDDSLLKSNNYSKIDWFCAPLSNNIIIYTKGNPDGKIVEN